jgi:hypothetical protein
MKSLLLVITLLFYSVTAFAEDHETKTFLVIFQSNQLKSLKVSVKDIESQFSSSFKTKSYQGNSVPSILIEVPNCDFDTCFLGDFLIELEVGKKIKLQELAFRLIDIGKVKKSYESELITHEGQHKKGLKSEKPERARSRS